MAEAIKSCMQLTSLHLACMYCLAMVDIVVLRVCSRWCAMTASGGDLGTGAGATAVAAALQNCTQLTSLNLACKWLGCCWRSSCSLVRADSAVLCPPDNVLQGAGGTAVAEAIKSCKQLTDLNMGGVLAPPVGALMRADTLLCVHQGTSSDRRLVQLWRRRYRAARS